MQLREPADSTSISKKAPRIVFLPQARFFCLALVVLFFLSTTALWISLDKSPGHWDDAWYLTNSLTLYDALLNHGFIGYWKKFLATLEFKAPLIAVLPTPLYGLFGRHSRVAYGVNLVFMALLLGAVYRFATRYGSPRAGLVAAYVSATMPLLYGLSRQYLVEYALTALVAVTVCCLVESRWLGETRWACCLGALCGFGLMLKITFPVYVFLPFCFACLQSLPPQPTPASPSKAHPATARLLLMRLLAFVAPLGLIALPWYGRNWSKTFDHAFRSGFSPMADLYGMGDPFTVVVVWRYLVHWVNDGISGGYFLLLVAMTGIALWHRARTGRSALPSEGRIFVLLWFLPFLVFLFGRNKDIRFTAPLLPAVAIALAWVADSLLSALKRWGRLAFSLLLAFPLLAYLHTSFGLLGSTRLTWGDIVLLAPRLSHARPPNPEVWPHREILEVLRRLPIRFSGEKRVMLGSDTAHFNANNFELAAADGLYSFQIATSAYEDDLPSLLNAANSTTFFLYKEGGEPGPQYTNRLSKPLLEDVQNSGKFFDLSTYPILPRLPTLPDGGRVLVYQNHWPNSLMIDGYLFDSAVEVPTCEVNFSNLMKLTGLAFTIEKQWLKVSYRWRCIGKLDDDLFCFTHVLDDQGRVLGFLDHAILGEPVMGWREGLSGCEILRYRLPESVNQVQLRLGLFRKAPGERVRIQEAHGLEGPTLAITDEGTAILATGMTPLPPMPDPAFADGTK